MVEFLLVTVGLIELHGLFNIPGRIKLQKDLKKVIEYTKEKNFDEMNDSDRKLIISAMLSGIFQLMVSVYGLLVLALGILFLPSPLNWLVLSTIGIGILAAYLRKVLDDEWFKNYLVLDYVYCASIFIIGPMIW